MGGGAAAPSRWVVFGQLVGGAALPSVTRPAARATAISAAVPSRETGRVLSPGVPAAQPAAPPYAFVNRSPAGCARTREGPTPPAAPQAPLAPPGPFLRRANRQDGRARDFPMQALRTLPAAQRGPDARRRSTAAREAYFL